MVDVLALPTRPALVLLECMGVADLLRASCSSQGFRARFDSPAEWRRRGASKNAVVFRAIPGLQEAAQRKRIWQVAQRHGRAEMGWCAALTGVPAALAAIWTHPAAPFLFLGATVLALLCCVRVILFLLWSMWELSRLGEDNDDDGLFTAPRARNRLFRPSPWWLTPLRCRGVGLADDRDWTGASLEFLGHRRAELLMEPELNPGRPPRRWPLALQGTLRRRCEVVALLAPAAVVWLLTQYRGWFVEMQLAWCVALLLPGARLRQQLPGAPLPGMSPLAGCALALAAWDRGAGATTVALAGAAAAAVVALEPRLPVWCPTAHNNTITALGRPLLSDDEQFMSPKLVIAATLWVLAGAGAGAPALLLLAALTAGVGIGTCVMASPVAYLEVTLSTGAAVGLLCAGHAVADRVALALATAGCAFVGEAWALASFTTMQYLV